MTEDRIGREFAGYARWRERLRGAVADFADWLHDQKLTDGAADQRLEVLSETLGDNRLHVAFVAEYSRGKSELINAIFFAGTGGRLLPSRAGRTTMCPTELNYDPQSEPSIRLLPIETRATGTTIAEYKTFTDEWQTIPLKLDDPAQVSEALAQVAQVRHVPPEDAESMGLHIAKDKNDIEGITLSEDGTAEIPRWRHAIVNYPHPLLEQGLVILDTPGLNALGAEPELTLNMLSRAHAVLFLLACDTGVTKSDMGVWQEHIRTVASGGKRVFVVLNKIDALWDELRDADEVDKEIRRQITDTARTLEVSEHDIFPVSAQKALLGKVREQDDIIFQSRIDALESALADAIIPSKQAIVRESVQSELSQTFDTARSIIAQRIEGLNEHRGELETLNSQNADVIEDMMAKIKVDKQHLEKGLQRFQATRSIFSQQTNLLYTHLNLRNLDSLIAEIKKDMSMSLTTSGLRGAMSKFFKHARAAMDRVTTQSVEIKELMDGVYRKFQDEHGLANVKPGSFSTRKYLRELEAIQQRQDRMLSGMSLVMREQMVVTRKFFESSVASVRKIFDAANRDADNWLKRIMSPMESQVREHQTQLRRRLESIKRIHKAADGLGERLNELRHVQEGHREQERLMEEKIERVDECLEAQIEPVLERTA